MFKKILIANRGEIAVRIIRACREWGISTVAVHSDVDRESMHVRMADESVCIGSHQPANSYLNIPNLMSAIELTNSDAVHPGYGFLSENANFAKILEDNKISFIGASSKHIKMMGDKIQAKKIAKENGLPVIEGSEGGVTDIAQAKELCKEIGFPVLIKASGGGGGKGMKIVYKEEEFETLFSTAKSEAQKYFGNDEVYIEKFFQNPRHIEVQILAGKNNVVHLHERDCSVQRRHQKLIEETPSPVLNDEIRKDLFERTVKMVAKIGYMGAGTVEFIYEDGKFYFLEMNTRVQVEHPVTEFITGVDIVREQLLVAGGAPLSYKQKEIEIKGHSIECRINAEDPTNFMPSPGRIEQYHPPGGLGVRVDSHIYNGYFVPPHYDSMIGKLIVQGDTREIALARMRTALDEMIIEGIKSNIPLHKEIMRDTAFSNGGVNIHYLEKKLGI